MHVKCVCICRILVSERKCSMGVDFVQLVIIMGACSLRICVLDSVGAQARLAYAIADLMYPLVLMYSLLMYSDVSFFVFAEAGAA